jgi:multimeric flavodoxin WrbA
MKILGIVGSTRKKNVSGVYQLVQTVLENTGFTYDLIPLKGQNISGCIACLGCVKDNVCKIQDDLAGIRDQIVQADAYVIGAPNYYSGMNAVTHAFMERWFQFRHQEGDALWGKLAVAVGVGGTTGRFPADDLEKFFLYNFIETVAKVTGQGAASCFSCGYGETCKVGVPYALYGEGVKITADMIPDVTHQPEVIQAAINAGKLLGRRLSKDHDRMTVTQNMQQKMMEMFKSSA